MRTGVRVSTTRLVDGLRNGFALRNDLNMFDAGSL